MAPDGGEEARLSQSRAQRIAVVIPCYRVADHILGVIERIPAAVSRIYVVDDACPQRSGDLVAARATDPRVVIVRHEANQGVGGAMVTGYLKAVAEGAEIVVKIDGDGQMDPALIPSLVAPIQHGHADYVKGNRFRRLDAISRMPAVRRIGNALLSLVCKCSTGYWDLLDPTNGFTATHREAILAIPLGRLSRRYFFETDMLFRLHVARAVVQDMPMEAVYGNETSGIRIWKVGPELLAKNALIALKRLVYEYLYHDFNAGTVQLIGAAMLLGFGIIFGAISWWTHAVEGVLTPTGTIMLAALPTILGFQMLLSFLNYDIAAMPRRPLSRPP